MQSGRAEDRGILGFLHVYILIHRRRKNANRYALVADCIQPFANALALFDGELNESEALNGRRVHAKRTERHARHVEARNLERDVIVKLRNLNYRLKFDKLKADIKTVFFKSYSVGVESHPLVGVSKLYFVVERALLGD